MMSSSSMTRQGRPEYSRILSGLGFCPEKNRLKDEFLKAIHELNGLQKQQTQAVIDGDQDFSRFDVLLHLAQEKKDNAKYAWMAHVESHRCEEA